MVCDWRMYWNLKYLGCILDKAEGCREVASGRRVGGAIRSLVNARDLQLECARILHETLLYTCSYVWQ